jgi:hypothetical protein
VAEITECSPAEQQRVRCLLLDRRDPSTIIPNHSPHAAHVARTPCASADSSALIMREQTEGHTQMAADRWVRVAKDIFNGAEVGGKIVGYDYGAATAVFSRS